MIREGCSAQGPSKISPRSGVLIGIPAHNEAETITEVVSEASNFADTILVVDDGSTDETARLAIEAGAVVVRHERNCGYGATLKTIFDRAACRSPEHLVVIDGDDQHDPSDIPKLVERQRETGAEIVIGSRFIEAGSTNAPLYRRFGIRVVNSLVNLGFRSMRVDLRVSDTQSGFRAYDPRAIYAFADNDRIDEHMGASLDILFQAADNRFDVEEVGTEISYPVGAESAENPISHGVTLVNNVLKAIAFGR